jgi:hypothetical protein
MVETLQGLLEPEPSKPGLSVLIAKHATARTTGKGEENRKKLELGLRRFGMGKTQARNFCHIRQKEKKTSC